VACINSSGYTANTRSDHAEILKKFYKFVRYGIADKTTPYPAEVAWVSTTVRKNELKEPDIITEEDARRMIDAAPSMRDKALISVAYKGDSESESCWA
jgi:integrase